MAWTEADAQKMDDAAGKAMDAFRKKVNDPATSPEFRAGMIWVAQWIKTWFMSAGYNRLCKMLKGEFA